MRARLSRVGAGFFVLWGLVHVLGGASMLAALGTDGGTAVYRSLASAAPAAVPDGMPGIASAVIGFHAWNLLWMGALVTVVALAWHWRLRRAGLWLNLAIAGFADLGLIGALLIPGYTRVAEGMIGIGLLVLAAGFSLAGLAGTRGERVPHPAGAVG